MTINIDQLLYEDEGPTLDFKSQQYPFEDASNEEKAELLKDIVGFANGFNRGQDGYILIGVAEVRGGKSRVIGLDKHLDDHSLQQFVTSKLNRAIDFSYKVVNCEEREIGVLHIKDQTGPFYLKKDFGKLKRGIVYIRRGSSIDLNNPATPDEIAAMGKESSRALPDIQVQFVNPTFDRKLGTQVSLSFEFCQVPSPEDIPLAQDPEDDGSYFYRISQSSTFGSKYNENYFRELAPYEAMRRWMRPVKILVENKGNLTGTKTRLEIDIPSEGEILVQERHQMPEKPEVTKNLLISTMPHINPIIKVPGRVEISTNGIDQTVAIEFDDLQPGRSVVSERFFIGVNKSGLHRLPVRIFSSSFSQSLERELIIDAQVKESKLTVDELLKLPDPMDGAFDV